MTQDLTKITTVFGLLDYSTQEALMAAFSSGKTIQCYGSLNGWNSLVDQTPCWFPCSVYRVEPEPVVHSVWFNVYEPTKLAENHTRAQADYNAKENRIAVLRVDYCEGEVTFHKESL